MRTFEKLSAVELATITEDVLASTRRIVAMSEEEMTTGVEHGVPPSEVAHLKLGILFQLRDELEHRLLPLTEWERELREFLTMVEDERRRG